MVRSVVVDARHYVRPEPPSRELSCRLVLVVETVVLHEHPVAFLDLLWSESVGPVEPFFIPHPRRP
jgi:hypothetical protein